jgi:hypothetical protein
MGFLKNLYVNGKENSKKSLSFKKIINSLLNRPLFFALKILAQ